MSNNSGHSELANMARKVDGLRCGESGALTRSAHASQPEG